MTYDVDVLIPCYNYARFLEAAVASTMSDGGPAVRVLIIDDASTDDTPRVAGQLTARHPNVSYVRHPSNRGHHRTYNEGLRWASSRYFVLLSADDLVAPGALGRATAFLDAHPDVGLVYGRTHPFHGEPPPLSAAQSGFGATTVEGIEFIRTASRHGHNPIECPSGVVVRTDLQHAVGDYHSRLPHAGDLEMWLRFAARANVGFLEIEQCLYRRHTDNMSLQYLQLRDYEQRMLAWQIFCDDHRDRIPEHDELRRNVAHALGAELFAKTTEAFERGQPLDLDAFLAVAAKLDPSIRRNPVWRRLRVKLLVGRRMTSLISSARDFITGRA